MSRDWKWEGKERFRWKGIWFHFNSEHMAYIGFIRAGGNNLTGMTSEVARFTVRRDQNQSWFARVWIATSRSGGLVETAIDERPNASPPGVLRSVCNAVSREARNLREQAGNLEAFGDIVADITWGNRGRR